MLYIVLFLHQTTTSTSCIRLSHCCISYYSYIKPQLVLRGWHRDSVVYRTIPTSNHNSFISLLFFTSLYIVLFLHQTTTAQTKSTLAHSCISYYSYIKPQLFGRFLIVPLCCISYYSYIKPQLYRLVPSFKYVVYRTIPTSNHNSPKMGPECEMLYIVLFLHQTTTLFS